MKICVLAEKPSQARDFYRPLIEKITGERMQNKGEYFENSQYTLSWFYGHLMQAYEPVEYDPKYKEWKLEDLPILPVDIKYKYRDAQIKRRGDILLGLCQNADKLVCATDPDREGEGIFRGFYDYNHIQKPVKRLWAVSLADEDLLKAWNNMKSSSEYDDLSAARYMRAAADWLVGMNASRAYSIAAYSKVPIGRVLTATLALIVNRDRDVEAYKEIFSYGLEAKWKGMNFRFFNEDGNKFESEDFCQKMAQGLGTKDFKLHSFKEENRKENPPKTFNLPELQKEANKVHGFSLDKTLELAQSLYEKKLTTYPRTDSQYLPESDIEKYYDLLDKLAGEEETMLLRKRPQKAPSVKDTDAAHTAIIPTGVEAKNLNPEEKDLYELIRHRFVTAFMLPRKYKQYTLIIEDEERHQLRARFNFDIDKGFKKLASLIKLSDDEENEEEEKDQVLEAELNESELKDLVEHLTDVTVTKHKKSKPKYYTAATLITAMQNCGKLLDDEQARQTLKEVKGIGTPATQATYPVNLEKYGYIKTVKKNFVSTPKGRSLIASIQDDLKSPELTADWEFKLKEMEKGRYSVDQFDKEIRDYVSNIVAYVREHGKSSVKVLNKTEPDKDLLPCPKCGRYLHEFDWGWACARVCSFKISKTIAGKKITQKVAMQLVREGVSGVVSGFKSKNGKEFSARLLVNGLDINFDFSYPHPCPKCGKELDNFKNALVCKARCGFELKKEINKKTLSEKNITDILTKKKSAIIKGFTSKQGGTFDARIIVDDQFRLRFERD